MEKTYYVYVLANKYNTVFYTGLTNDLRRRVYEHKNKLVRGFTFKYNVSKLVYFEMYDSINDAIEREKQLKDYRREKKLALIQKKNSQLDELSV